MYRNDKIEYTTNDDGRKVAILEIGTQNLPVIHIDTYQTFTGESAYEYEWDYITSERGVPERLFEISWGDQSEVKRQLAEASHEWLQEFLGYEVDEHAVQPIGEVTGVWSPRYYNFATNSYDARYEIDLERMEAWIAKRNWDHEAFGLEYFKSYSGYHSHVPGYLKNPDMSEGVRLWLFVYAYLLEALDSERDQDSWFYHMLDAESEIQCNTITPEWDESGLENEIDKRAIERHNIAPAFELQTPDFEPFDEDAGEKIEAWIDEQVAKLAA